MKKDRFEAELARHLGPVKAPDGLWDRVQGAAALATTVRARPAGWSPGIIRTSMWVAAALSMIAITAGVTVWLNHDLSGEQRAVRALSRTPQQLQFHSGNLSDLRTWVKNGSGLDVPLPMRTAAAVQIVGATVSRKGVPTAEILYRVGDVDASLVVSKIPQEGDGRHAFVKAGTYHGASFLSWTMRGQMYTIAASDAKVGCLLCHSAGAPRESFN
ncbi:MAG TPA: hypothetical protein VGJ09_05830 [Bryobacteraceae bacterium]